MAKLLWIFSIIIAGVLWMAFIFDEAYSDVHNIVHIAFFATVLACTFWYYYLRPEVFAKATVLKIHFPKPWKPGTMEATFLVDGEKIKLELTLEQFKSIAIGDIVLIKYKGPQLISIARAPTKTPEGHL